MGCCDHESRIKHASDYRAKTSEDSQTLNSKADSDSVNRVTRLRRFFRIADETRPATRVSRRFNSLPQFASFRIAGAAARVRVNKAAADGLPKWDWRRRHLAAYIAMRETV